MKRINILTIALCVAILPSMALANTGTPLMWATMLHLFIGNLVIGLLEGYLLAKLFKLHKGKSIAIMILANYFSAWLGAIALNFGDVKTAFSADLYSVRAILWKFIAIAYISTLIIEFPFVVFALRKEPRRWIKAITGSLFIQTVSYLLLIGWYCLASPTTLISRTEIVQLSSMSLPERVIMYFIAAEDGNVYSMNLATAERCKNFDLKSFNSNDHVVFRESRESSNQWDAIVGHDARYLEQMSYVVFKENLKGEEATPSVPNSEGDEFEVLRLARLSLAMQHAKLGAAKNSPWEFSCGWYAAEGLYGKRTDTGEKLSLAFDTPFLAWPIRNITQLPDDKVLFQLGENQICVFDLKAKQVALVAKGRGAALLLETEKPKQNPVNNVSDEADSGG